VVDMLDEAVLEDHHRRVHRHTASGWNWRMMRTSCSRRARSLSSAPSGRCRKTTPRSPRPPPPRAAPPRAAGQLERIRARIVGAGVAAGAADQRATLPCADPAGERAGDAEVGVVGVGDDDQHALRPVGVRRGLLGTSNPGRRSHAVPRVYFEAVVTGA
jgi:hypothetical protein